MTNLENCILDNFGGLAQNSLSNILNPSDSGDPMSCFLTESPYFEPASLVQYLSKYLDNFTVLSLNAQSLNAKFDGIQTLISQLNEQRFSFSALCFQETWIKDCNSGFNLLNLHGYNTIPLPATVSSHSGLVIYLQEDYKFKIRSLQSHSSAWEGQFIDICHSSLKRKITLCNIYRPPRENLELIQVFLDEVSPILDQLNKENSDIICLGDFNLDLLKVNSKQPVSDFLDIFTSFGLIPTITLPTRIHSSATLIDNIFYTATHKDNRINSGIILTDVSDHMPCFLCIDNISKKTKSPKYIKIQHFSQSSLDDFVSELNEKNVANYLDTSINCDPNENYDKFLNCVTDAKNKHLPIKTVKFNKRKHKVTPWITKGIILSINYRDRLYKSLKSTSPSSTLFPTLKHNLKTYNSILKKSIRYAKQIYYKNQFQKFKQDSRKTWGMIKSILNKKTSKTFPEYFKIDEHNVYDKSVIAEGFNKFFASIGEDLSSKIKGPSNKSFTQFLRKSTCNFQFSPVSSVDVLNVISKLPSKTSMGHDDISNKVMKPIKHAISEPLALIINQSFLSGIFPDKLKLAKVFPIFKKGDDFVFTNYRPISLLPVFSKIFEKLSYSQFYSFLVNNKLLFTGQHGFRTGHSTETATYELLDRINISLDNGFLPICVYLDLSKAFDTLDHSILLEKLNNYGVSGPSLLWFQSYLSNRLQFTVFNDSTSSSLPLATGVPQGSILGPLLFLVYINDIYKASEKLQMILYADDTTLISSLSPTSLYNDILKFNDEIVKVHEWLLLNKLSLNISKTRYMIFHFPQRNINFDVLPNIMIGNQNVLQAVEFDFLGVVINQNLNWKPHIAKISSKIARANGSIRRLKNFLPKHVLMTIYNSLILPHLTFGVLAWGYSCPRIVNLQKKSIRYINQSKYNAHTEPLFKHNSILKFTDLFHLTMLKFYYKHTKNKLPDYFSTMFLPRQNSNPYDTRNSKLPLPQVPKMSSCINCIRYSIPKILDNTPSCISDKLFTHSLDGVSIYFKRYVIDKYSTECTIAQCFICSRI